MIGGKHKSNIELVAQGGANIFSSIFGGIPATGAIARTATNVKNGGRTPIAGITHAVTLLIIMLFVGKWATLIPLSCLAGILVVVAFNMSEYKSFISMLRGPRSDVAVLVVTFFLTVLVDLTVAIEIGMVLAVFLFMRRMTQISNVGIVTKEMNDTEAKDDPNATEKYSIPPGIEVFEITGPFFFGAAYKFKESMQYIENPPKVLIIRMRFVPVIDATGLHTLEEVFKQSDKLNTKFILSGVQPGVLHEFKKSGLLGEIGESNVHANFEQALNRAKEIIS